MRSLNGRILIFGVCIMLMASCKKDFLDKNPRTDLIIPNTPMALWALLDNDNVMNRTPTMGELSSDNYYLTFQYWQTLQQNHERNSYIWAKNIYEGQQNVDDWSRSYSQVLHANTVLEGLNLVDPNTSSVAERNAIKGSALFFRANAYYNLAQIFAPVYDSSTAVTDLGLPIRTEVDINTKVPRHTVKQTYDSILNYLDQAEGLVEPGIQYNNKNRVSKPAVLALKARVYLSMRAYTQAGNYADQALQLHDSLIDYNEIDSMALLPFSIRNKETIFQSRFTDQTQVLTALIYPEVIIDSILLKMYNANDRRKAIYYTNFFGPYILKGSYSGSISPFTGLATDELYLIRAESNARAGNIAEAMDDLNKLLLHRYGTGTFTPLNPTTQAEALQLIKDERRKELAFRGLRWPDLRRYNKEGAGIDLQRVLNGQIYTIQHNSIFFVLPIPPEVIRLGGLINNER